MPGNLSTPLPLIVELLCPRAQAASFVLCLPTYPTCTCYLEPGLLLSTLRNTPRLTKSLRWTEGYREYPVTIFNNLLEKVFSYI